MGFFSTKKTIVVASSVYNMAGDEDKRSNFLKSSVFAAVMSPHDTYIGETVVGSHLGGPGIKQRSFFNWAVRNNYAGLPSFSLTNQASLDPDVVKPFIPVPGSPAGLVTEIQSAFITSGDYSPFADKYVLENYPSLANTDYISEYNASDHTITIQFVGGSTVNFSAGIYSPTKRFMIATHYHQIPESVEPLVAGNLITGITSTGSLPSNTGFTLQSTTNTGVNSFSMSTVTTVTKVYSNGNPTTTETTYQNFNQDFNSTHSVWFREQFLGGNGGIEVTKLRTFNNRYENRHKVTDSETTVVVNNLGGGVTETVTTEVEGDFLRPIYNYRVDTQEVILSKMVGGVKMWVYEIGTGNVTLDAISQTISTNTPEYFPFMPIRLNNRSITHQQYVDNNLLAETKTAYRRASGENKFLKLVDEVEDNPDLGEIDYAYVQYGVALNVKEKACRKYIYNFLAGLIPFQNTTATYMSQFASSVASYDDDVAAYNNWLNIQTGNNPDVTLPRPPLPRLVQPRTTTITLRSGDPRTSANDNRITWVSINESLHSGVGKTGAKKNDVWFAKDGAFTWTEEEYRGSGEASEWISITNRIEKINLFWQTSSNTYKRLTIHGLTHQNFIYGGKSVDTPAHEAIDDPDPSGFIIPLHMPTVRAMSLIDATQMATANTWIVFNSYKIYKKKWYQTFLGMVLIVVAVIVLAAIVAPAAIGGMTGFLGTNAAVGASLGLTGTAGIVAGALSNALVAILISTAITSVSTAIFGEKWGAMIGAIASFAVSFGMAGGFTNITMSTMMTPQNILAFSSALANGYSGFVQANIAEIAGEMENNAQKYKEQMSELERMIKELGGGNDLSFDPMQLTDVSAGNGQQGRYIVETLDEFIHRTTLTGSDIVDVTLSLIENHSQLSLELPR